MNIKRIIHLGIMVNAMGSAKDFFHQTLGLNVAHEELYDGEVDICFLPTGDSSVELFADNPLTGKNSVGHMITQNGGEGIHHVAFEVDDIESAVNELKAKKIPIQKGYPKDGAQDTIVVFLEPSATHGVLIELVQCNSTCSSPKKK